MAEVLKNEYGNPSSTHSYGRSSKSLLEKARKDAEIEEKRFQKALEQARKDLGLVSGEKLEELNSQIAQLEQNLKEAHEAKERAISRAQETKSGHVYIISNLGSFGETVYKIGLTRRLELRDREKELGDVLVVVVATDNTAVKMKKRQPLHSQEQRQELVNSLSMVDLCLIGQEDDIFKTVNNVRPQIIALGYDQAHQEKFITEGCKKINLDASVARLQSPIPDSSSSKIEKEYGESIHGI